jgi:hypothetical protein
MPKKIVKWKQWAKPELKRIGQLKDVAGPSGVGAQGANSRS